MRGEAGQTKGEVRGSRPCADVEAEADAVATRAQPHKSDEHVVSGFSSRDITRWKNMYVLLHDMHFISIRMLASTPARRLLWVVSDHRHVKYKLQNPENHCNTMPNVLQSMPTTINASIQTTPHRS
jgi:hypothetical protein